VFDLSLHGVEVGLIAFALGGRVDEVEQPGRALGVALNVQIGVADHIHNHERFDLLQRAIFLPFFGQMAGAVDAVGVAPGLHGFFAVGPDQPDAVAIALLIAQSDAQLVGVFKQDGGRRSAVVGAHVSDIAQRVVGVVVAHDDDDAVFRAG